MILFSGWILPNGVVISCPSNLDSSFHINIVENYLEKIKKENSKLYSEILTKKLQYFPYIEADDIAIFLLGWIKISDYPLKIILSPKEFSINKNTYLALGYKIIELFDDFIIKEEKD